MTELPTQTGGYHPRQRAVVPPGLVATLARAWMTELPTLPGNYHPPAESCRPSGTGSYARQSVDDRLNPGVSTPGKGLSSLRDYSDDRVLLSPQPLN